MSTTPNPIVTLIDNSQLEVATADALKLAFAGAYDQAKEWDEKAKTIIVTDASQLKEMKLAKESRLALRKVRTGVEDKRKELKADALNYGRTVDAIANELKGLIEPIEAHLLEQEEFAKRIEAKRIEEMKQARIEELTGWGVDTQYLDLGGMPEAVFTKMLTDAKAAHEARIEAQRKAEEEAARLESERIAREKAEADARELQRLENERLKREAEERQAQIEKERQEMQAKLAEERRLAELALKAAEEKAEYERQVAAQRIHEEHAKAKAERDALEAKATAEQAKRDAEAAAERERLEKEMLAERDAREKAETAARIKAAEEAAAKKAEEAAAKKAAKAPDKTKLAAFAATIRGLAIPVLTTEEGKAFQTLLEDQTEKFALWVESQAAKL